MDLRYVGKYALIVVAMAFVLIAATIYLDDHVPDSPYDDSDQWTNGMRYEMGMYNQEIGDNNFLIYDIEMKIIDYKGDGTLTVGDRDYTNSSEQVTRITESLNGNEEIRSLYIRGPIISIINSFNYCPNLERVYIDVNADRPAIENSFNSCDSLEFIQLPEGLEELELNDCPSLSSLIIPYGCESVSLSDIPNIGEILIPDGCTFVYMSNVSNLRSLGIPLGCNRVSLDNCNGLEYLDLADVDSVLLRGCTSITEIATSDDSDYYFENGALYSRSTDNIVWYGDVDTVHIKADTSRFVPTHAVSDIYVDPLNTHYQLRNGVLYYSGGDVRVDNKTIVYVLPGYQGHLYIDDDVSGIFEDATEFSEGVDGVVVDPDNRWFRVRNDGTVVANYAYHWVLYYDGYGSSSERDITVSYTAELDRDLVIDGNVSDFAFRGNDRIRSVIVNGDLGFNSFEGCTNLREAVVNGFVGIDSFRDCTGLVSATVAGSVSSGAFYGCVSNSFPITWTIDSDRPSLLL